MADAGDVVADLLMAPLRQVMALYLQDLGPTIERVVPAELDEPVRASTPSGVNNVVMMPTEVHRAVGA
jgi:hypothetical protein